MNIYITRQIKNRNGNESFLTLTLCFGKLTATR